MRRDFRALFGPLVVSSHPFIRRSIATQARIGSNPGTLSPSGARALTHLIAGLVRGQPDYAQIGPGLAQLTRQELPDLQAALVPMGPLQSLSFKRVDPAGLDIYDVKFERGTFEFQILLDAQGRVSAAQFSP